MQQTLVSPMIASIQLAGHLNASNSQSLQEELQQALLSSNCSIFVADMRQVESLDSSGLMALVATLNLAQERGQSFVLAGVSPSIQIIFELTQLDQAFEIRDDLLQPSRASSLVA